MTKNDVYLVIDCVKRPVYEFEPKGREKKMNLTGIYLWALWKLLERENRRELKRGDEKWMQWPKRKI